MKAIFAALFWCLTLFSVQAVGQNSRVAKGCVVFKPGSEAVASFVEYQSYRQFRTGTQVKDNKGGELRVFPGQNPIFIPYPSGSSAISKETKSKLDRALRTYPELGSQLAAVQQAWAAAPRKKSATESRSKSRKTPVKPQRPPPLEPIAMDLRTLDGTKYEIVKILGAEADGLKVMTRTGIQKIPAIQLPPDVQKQYGYDPEAVAAAQREMDLRAQKATEEDQRRKADDEAKAANWRKLRPAIAQGAVQIFGSVLRKTEDGVLVSPKRLDGSAKPLPGIAPYDKVSLLKGYPRANEWAEDDAVNVIAVPDGPTTRYADKSGIRREAKGFKWIPNPLPNRTTDAP